MIYIHPILTVKDRVRKLIEITKTVEALKLENNLIMIILLIVNTLTLTLVGVLEARNSGMIRAVKLMVLSKH